MTKNVRMWLHMSRWRVQLPSPVQSNGNLSLDRGQKKSSSSRMMWHNRYDVRMWYQDHNFGLQIAPHFDYLLVAFLSQNQKKNIQRTISNAITYLYACRLHAYFSVSLSLFTSFLIGATARALRTLSYARLHKFWNSNRFTLFYWYADKSKHQIGLDNMVRYLMKSSGLIFFFSFFLSLLSNGSDITTCTYMFNQVAKSQFI